MFNISGGRMFYRQRSARRALLAALLVVSFVFTLFNLPIAQTQPRALNRSRTVGSAAHDDNEGHKKTLTRQQRAREAWVWHEANKQRLEQNDARGAEALTTDIVSQDTNDIAVIQGDTRLITPPNSFDLTGRAVQFTPSGASYTINTANATFDDNLGNKLNLAVAPAVNPSEVAEPGDDAYIIQDFGFSFNFYGVSYNSLAIVSNGNLVFRPNNITQRDFDLSAITAIATLAEFQEALPRIAPYWHDLDGRPSQTQGANGVYLRRDNDRVVITWNNVRDFPNDPAVDRGRHRFQATLFRDGRIVFTYDTVQLTSQALAGISPGLTQTPPTLVDFNNPPGNPLSAPIAEFFSSDTRVDYLGAVQAFYATHPGRDVYDFIYFITDFEFDLGGGAFAFYQPLRNEANGIGQPVFDDDPSGSLGSRKIQGVLNLSNFDPTSGFYPVIPTVRFLGANHALSIMGQEQGHRWLSYVKYPGTPEQLLGRDDSHWSFFMNIESTISSPAARRSSSMEGNVWRENDDGSFTSVNLIDGFSRLDHYLMGLRPPSDVPDTFIITNLTTTGGRDRESNPRPNINVRGTKQTVTVNQIIEANGARTPAATVAQKNFRAAVVLLVRQGTQPTQEAFNRITLYRLAWESYFAQSTDFLATISTGLADQTVPRHITALSAASYKPTLAPGEIAALFGLGLAANTAIATEQPLPTTLANVRVLIDGQAAPLFFVSPTQINFQVPRNTAATTVVPSVSSATALIEVYSGNQLIRAGAFQIAPSVPGFFTINASGTGAAAAVDAFTGARAPFNARQANGQPNIIAVFGSGLGADVTDVEGNIAGNVQAIINGQPAPVSYAGRAPGFTGLNQLNIGLPEGIAPGTYTLVILRNGIPSREVTITIQ
jgi:uncharacterized protein (TIGR03437 family)